MGVTISKNLLSNVGGTIFFSWKLSSRISMHMLLKNSKTFSWINGVFKALQLHFYHMSLFSVYDVVIMNLPYAYLHCLLQQSNQYFIVQWIKCWKGLITYFKANGIIVTRNHVDVEHFNLVHNLVKEVSSTTKRPLLQ
jgi:hypothetical protein